MGINIKGVIKGALISVLLAFLLIMVLSLVSYFTSAGENVITICAYGSVILGSLAGSAIVAMGAPEKKMIHVLLVCALYTCVLAAVSAVMNGSVSFNAHTAAVIGGIFASAFVGLLIGSR